jgi:hypothetical protein
MYVEGNIREPTRASAAFRQPGNSDDEMSANSLGTLRRMPETSTREVDNLISELQTFKR